MSVRAAAGIVGMAVLVAVTGCATSGSGPATVPEGARRLEVRTVEFDPSGVHGPPFTAVVDDDASARAVAGWFAAAEARGATVPASMRTGGPDRGDTVWVVSVANTGCRLPTAAGMWWDGDARTMFTGGAATDTCYRPYTPLAVLEVSREQFARISELDDAPIDRDGPAETVGAIELAPGAPDLAPQEITDPDARAALAGVLVDTTEVGAVVNGASLLSGDHGARELRRYAFPVRMCPRDQVSLVVEATRLHTEVRADPEAPATCEAPTTHLVVFDLRAVHVPAHAVPTVG